MTTKNSLREGTLSRRWFLGTVPVAVAGLAACSSSSDTTGSATSTSTPTAASTAVATGVASPGSVAALAQAFCTTLTAEQLPVVLLDYSLANAERWSNLPQGLLGSAGAGGAGMPSGGGSGRPSGRPSDDAAGQGGGQGGGPGGAGGSQSRVGISLGDLSQTSWRRSPRC